MLRTLRMSVYGYKRTFWAGDDYVRFTPESGHSEAQERRGLKKQTFDVRFAPKSGRQWVWRGMSAFDPKRTLTGFTLNQLISDFSIALSRSDILPSSTPGRHRALHKPA